MTPERTTRRFGFQSLLTIACAAMALSAMSPAVSDATDGKGESPFPEVVKNPPAPEPEAIEIQSLPLPPTAPTLPDGTVIPEGCANPTGCISPETTGIVEGPSYMWDNEHVLLTIEFAGAPAGSIYEGEQLIAIKTTEGASFPSGDPWKCITCGVPPENRAGASAALDHPQAVHDGTRVKAGRNIVACGDHSVADDACTPAVTHIFEVRSPTSLGPPFFFSPREIRLSPDDTTLGFSQTSANFVPGPGGVSIVFSQFCYAGQLQFNPAPGGGEPPRYDLVDVFRLYNAAPEAQAWHVDPMNPGHLLFQPNTQTCGELRGFSADGKEAYGLNFPTWSNHIDLFATDLESGKTRRVTRTEYIDPGTPSPDDKWFLGLDVHVAQRSHWVAAMDGLPPVNDMITTGLVSQTRNNGNRRFFQPMLLDRYGQRGDYQGQQLNGGFDAGPGGIGDPNWNARADPAWSPDGTKIVYWQTLVTSPECGGGNSLPCPDSTEPGGRRTRLLIADLVSRGPKNIKGPRDVRQVGSWAQPLATNPSTPLRPIVPEGSYSLAGKVSGTVTIEVTHRDNGVQIQSVSVVYEDFSNDCRVFNGFEIVAVGAPVGQFQNETDWNSDITMSGCETGTKITRDENGDQGTMSLSAGGNIFEATGTLTTTIDGEVFDQPANGT